MLIKDIIHHFEVTSPWVDTFCTKDVVLFGDVNKEVHKIGVCWVATNRVLEECAKQDIHFIISHENCFYMESTSIPKPIYQARLAKQAFCAKHDITIYRCHDCWDRFPVYGVADALSKLIDIAFQPRDVASFYTSAEVHMSVAEIAQCIANALKPYGADYVEILGDAEKIVHKPIMGVGAISDTSKMKAMEGDLFICSDDGVCNWIDLQWCVDQQIPVILFHHSTCEIPGLEAMAHYLNNTFPDCECIKCKEGFDFTLVKAEKS